MNRFLTLDAPELRARCRRYPKGRLALGTIALLLMFIVAPFAAAAAPTSPTSVVPDPSANAVVPAPFNANMSWSQEGGWHWVTLSYVGTNTTNARTISPAYFVATLVKTMQSSDECADCPKISDHEQGPPIIFGGPSDPTIGTAYQNLDNGPRSRQPDGHWSAGSWYLNYSPVSHSFFSWTWVPGSANASASTTAEGGTPTSTATTLGFVSTQAGAKARVFPLAGSYTVTQGFGCVPTNDGYPTSPSCPPEKPSFHNGIDLGVPAGTPIVAAASGTVTFDGMSSNQEGANSRIVIQHDGQNSGYQTVYLHWERSFVKVGDHVAAGQQIAAVGSVGYSTGPHLHFTVMDAAGNALDPVGWLSGATVPVIGTGQVSVAATAGVLQWRELMQAAAEQYQVPVAFIAAIMTVESGGDPSAVSAVGAQGLMQVMPDQLTALGVVQDKWLDPASNIDAGARYMAQRLAAGMSLQDVAASYFGQGCDVYGTCTEQYVAKIMGWYSYYTSAFAGQPATPPFLNAQPAQRTPSEEVVQPQQAPPPATPAPAPSPTPSPSPSPGQTATPTPTPSPSPPGQTATPTPSPQASPSPTPSPSPSPSPSANPSASPSPAASPSPSPSPTEKSSPTTTPTGTAVPDASPTESPSPSPTTQATPTASPTPPPSPTATESTKTTTTPTGTATASPTPTPSPSPSPTATPETPWPVISPDGIVRCGNFATQQQAQQWFTSQGGSATHNIYGMDNDHDGIVCQTLP